MQAVRAIRMTRSSCSLGMSGDHRQYRRPAVSATIETLDYESWRTVLSTTCTTPYRHTLVQHGAFSAWRAHSCGLQSRICSFVAPTCSVREHKVQLTPPRPRAT